MLAYREDVEVEGDEFDLDHRAWLLTATKAPFQAPQDIECDSNIIKRGELALEGKWHTVIKVVHSGALYRQVDAHIGAGEFLIVCLRCPEEASTHWQYRAETRDGQHAWRQRYCQDRGRMVSRC